MAIINLRRYYPHYPKDKFLDVPDEVAVALEDGRRAEYNQERKRKYHHVISIDASPCVENHTMFLVVSPEELILQDENEAATRLELAAAIARLSPIQSRRLHARYALNKKFREIAADEGISGSCAVKTVTAAVTRLQKFFIENGWMPKEV